MQRAIRLVFRVLEIRADLKAFSLLQFGLVFGNLCCPSVAPGEPTHLPNAGTVIHVSASGSACEGETPILGYDGTIENGIQWRGEGVQGEYVGAFGQAFDLGPGVLKCAQIWLTQEGFYDDTLSDVYVWSDGIGAEPGDVLLLLPGIVFANVPIWPEVGENRVSVQLPVDSSFTIGCWGRWPGEVPGKYYWATDSNGTIGPAWTYIGFDQGFPVGWQHPSVVWSESIVRSMAMGVVFESSPVPVGTSSWGRVKRMYR